MGAIKELNYRTFDSLLDEIRLEMSSFNSAGDIDASVLIPIAQTINYELGLRIYQMKESMLEVEHGRAKLPADFNQMNLALICYEYRNVSTAPWNGNVLLEQLENPLPTNTTDNNPVASTDVFCWTLTIPSDAVCNDNTHCTQPGNFSVAVKDINGSWYVKCLPIPSITTGLIAQLVQVSSPTALTCPIPSDQYDNYIKKSPAYLKSDGTYTCTQTTCPPGDPNLQTGCCDICNIVHTNDNCPELVINPYPLGKCRTICNDSIGIKILRYCEASVECYERFERLYIDPFIQASGFNSQKQFGQHHNRGAINGKFLEVPYISCTKVYINYLGALEDDDNNLLVLDHPKINEYYKARIKRVILENLYLNGEDMIQRLQYMEKKEEEYKQQALSIVNMPDFRNMINIFTKLRQEHNRRYYFPLSRYHGKLGWADPIDSFESI